ncbi:MAG: OmpH family outer membrane protein [Bacteroidales bacterium]|jgi:outer membrane protein|nr:OmpH family outer membrane protein [Bacteroidales bacterium]
MSEEQIITHQEEKPEDKLVSPKNQSDNIKTLFKVLTVLSFAGVIALFILFFTQKNETAADNAQKKVDNATFAFVNTDTIWSEYDFVLDVQVDLVNLEKIYQNQYTTAVSKFQKEYEEYIKKGTAGMLSLNEQKKTEEYLAKKQQDIQEMEAQLSQQLLEEKSKKNQEVHDTIVHFITRYNKSKNYTFIYEKSFGGGLLYANPALDITKDILTGLNKEYEEWVNNKESDTITEE